MCDLFHGLSFLGFSRRSRTADGERSSRFGSAAQALQKRGCLDAGLWCVEIDLKAEYALIGLGDRRHPDFLQDTENQAKFDTAHGACGTRGRMLNAVGESPLGHGGVAQTRVLA